MCKEQVSINALKYNGETHTDSLAKASILNNQFKSVFTKDDHLTLYVMRGNSIPDIEQVSIEVNGVHNLLANIDPHKATKPDGIPSRLSIKRDCISDDSTYIYLSMFIGPRQASFCMIGK